MTIERYVWGQEEGTGGSGGAASDVTYSEAVSQLGADNVQSAVDVLAGRDVTATTGVATYYVRTTGNDNNTGLTIGDALLTPQAAVNKVPRYIKHNVTIDIGAGNFAGFRIANYEIIYPNIFTIVGELGAPTLATGTTSGTATGGDTLTCVDGGQSWTVNDLRGKLVLIAGEYRVVRNNTSTTINLVGAMSATCSGKAYSLLEQKTIINTTAAGGSGRVEVYLVGTRSTTLVFRNIRTTGGAYGIYAHSSGLHIERGRFELATSYGLYNSGNGDINIFDSYAASNTSAGFLFQTLRRVRDIERIYAYNNGVAGYGGIAVFSALAVYGGYWYADYNGANGIYIFGAPDFEVLPGGAYTSYNGENGVRLEAVAYAGFYAGLFSDHNTLSGLVLERGCAFGRMNSGDLSNNGTYGMRLGNDTIPTADYKSGNVQIVVRATTINNNTLDGIYASLGSTPSLVDVTGTGNGSYGIRFNSATYGLITSATTVTGVSGNATVDEGKTVLSWATDFANNGDIVSNLATGATIERRD